MADWRTVASVLSDVDNLHVAGLRYLGQRLNYGTTIYDRKRDVLVLLDACRFDLFQEFASRHDVFDRFESFELVTDVRATSTRARLP